MPPALLVWLWEYEYGKWLVYVCCCFPVADNNWISLYWQDTMLQVTASNKMKLAWELKPSYHPWCGGSGVSSALELDLGFNHESAVYYATLAKFISSFWVSVTSFLGWGDMDSIEMFWELNEILWFLATVLVLSYHLNVILLFPISSASLPPVHTLLLSFLLKCTSHNVFQICVMNVSLEKWFIWEEALLDMSVWNVPREHVFQSSVKDHTIQNSSLLLPIVISALVGNREKNYLFSLYQYS